MKMILHNLKVAVRNLMKYKLQTAISVLSIAVGIVTLSFTHSLIKRFQHPAISRESYFDRTYQLSFLSIDEGKEVEITNDIVRAVKKEGVPASIEKMAVPNGYPHFMDASFHLVDSTIRKGHVCSMIIDPEYANLSGFRSAITGKKIRVLKQGEAIISEDMARRVFKDKNPVGAIQTSTNEVQTIPVTIVDVYKSLSVWDSPVDNNKIYFTLTDDIAEQDFNGKIYGRWIAAVLKKDITKTQLEKEITERIKPLGLKVKLKKMSDKSEFDMIISIQFFGYMIGALILIAAIIGFLRIEIQLFHIRRRELALRIVNGAKRLQLFYMLLTEILICLVLAVGIAIILGVMLQDFCNVKLNILVNNFGFTLRDLWRYSLLTGGGLLAVCSLTAWLTLYRIGRNSLAEKMRKSRNHFLRNVMLCIQTVICIVFVCSTFIIVNAGNHILKQFNIPDNDKTFKEYIHLDPSYSSDPAKLIDEIKRLPDLDKALVCDDAYHTMSEIKDNDDIKEKLNNNIYFSTYTIEDTATLSALGMDVEWFKHDIDRNDCILICENLYRQLKDLGVLDNNVLTPETYWNNDRTLPIAGIIRSIAYDSEGMSVVVIQPDWLSNGNYPSFLLIPKQGKGASLARSVDETIERVEPELINKMVSNYSEKVSPLPGFVEAIRSGGMILGCVSLLICAMSIFSTITLDTRARRKEVAIRKVNGAKSRDIYRMFGRIYVVLIAVSILIAVPICVMFNKIVESFGREVSSETALSPVVPIISGCLIVTVLILAIVGWQIHRTMQVDPAKIIAKE